jgi:hypothetical protein
MISSKAGLSFHEWWIEFEPLPNLKDTHEFAKNLEVKLKELNIYYKDLVVGNVLKPLQVVIVKKGGFNDYMKKEGKLGGQNKLPRLSNDRKIVSEMKNLVWQG